MSQIYPLLWRYHSHLDLSTSEEMFPRPFENHARLPPLDLEGSSLT